jgi:hypothetical protein
VCSKKDLDGLIVSVLNYAERDSKFLDDLKTSGGAKFIKDYLYGRKKKKKGKRSKI